MRSSSGVTPLSFWAKSETLVNITVRVHRRSPKRFIMSFRAKRRISDQSGSTRPEMDQRCFASLNMTPVRLTQTRSLQVESPLSFLINLQRGHYIQRALQNWIVRRRLFRRAPTALLRRFCCFDLGIGSGQQRRFVHMRPAGFVNKRAHSFFAALLKYMLLVRQLHLVCQILLYSHVQ